MKASGIAVLTACALAVLAPATAAAKPDQLVLPEMFKLSAELPKSNGFSISLETFGHRNVEVFATRSGETAYYLVKGRANRNGIEADFGRFGKLKASFEGKRVKDASHLAGCRGRRPVKARGVLEGTLRFRGERGFVSVSVHRVKATWEHSFREVCEEIDRPGLIEPRPRAAGEEEDLFATDTLEVRGREEGRSISFSAIHLDALGGTLVSASAFERVGRITTLKLASAVPEKGKVVFSPEDSDPQSVVVEPSSPFHGTGTYTAQPSGPNDWTGDLRVRFPGLGTVGLTGPSFHAYACRRDISELDGCGSIRNRARILYGSGSHSQPLALARLSSLR